MNNVRSVLISACVGVIAFGFTYYAGARQPVQDAHCVAGNVCSLVPICPNPTGTCNSCTSANKHLICATLIHHVCTVDPPVFGNPNGCGKRIDGTCSVAGTCVQIVTNVDCGRRMCH